MKKCVYKSMKECHGAVWRKSIDGETVDLCTHHRILAGLIAVTSVAKYARSLRCVCIAERLKELPAPGM